MQLNLVDTKKSIDVSEKTFADKYNESLVHQVVTAYMAGARQGTHAQKTRAEVRGGGKKPWRQKGTGRARAGTIRSPIWRGGGIIFAAKNRDYSQKVNKKMHRAAMRSIISELVRLDRLHVFDTLSTDSPKTKAMVAKLKELNIDNALIVVDELDENLYLSTRNIPHVEVCDVQSLNPVSLIRYQNVIMNQGAIKKIEELLG